MRARPGRIADACRLRRCQSRAARDRRATRPTLPGLTLSFGHPGILPAALPEALAGAEIAVIDHTAFPIEIARRCAGLTDVVFLGTGARSYMDPEALAGIGIAVHIIKGYGDTAVAECAIGLLFAAARGFAAMDRGMRAGQWLRTEGAQLGGKTLGLVGFGGIAAETARMALGLGMKVLAWNRTPKSHPGVEFVPIERLLADSDAISLHLLLNHALLLPCSFVQLGLFSVVGLVRLYQLVLSPILEVSAASIPQCRRIASRPSANTERSAARSRASPALRCHQFHPAASTPLIPAAHQRLRYPQ